MSYEITSCVYVPKRTRLKKNTCAIEQNSYSRGLYKLPEETNSYFVL